MLKNLRPARFSSTNTHSGVSRVWVRGQRALNSFRLRTSELPLRCSPFIFPIIPHQARGDPVTPGLSVISLSTLCVNICSVKRKIN